LMDFDPHCYLKAVNEVPIIEGFIVGAFVISATYLPAPDVL